MRNKCFFSIVAIIVAAGAAQANAQDVQSEAGLYGRISAGATIANDIDQTLAVDPGLTLVAMPPTQQRIETNTGYTLGAALGFKYPSGFRTELEYRFASTSIDLIEQSGGSAPAATLVNDDSVTAHFLMSNVTYDFETDFGLTPYVGVGVGGARVSLGDVAVLGNVISESDMAVAFQGRVGLALDLSQSARVNVEYVYARTLDLEFASDDDDAMLGGEPYISSSVLIGLTKDF